MQIAPYTGETLDRIRAYARQAIPPGYVAAVLGWDMAQLKRVADRHAIDFSIPKPVERKTETVNGISWDGECVAFNDKFVQLAGVEVNLFTTLFRSPHYNEWNREKLCERCSVPLRSFPFRMTRLRMKLKTIGLTVTNKRPYRLEQMNGRSVRSKHAKAAPRSQVVRLPSRQRVNGRSG